VRDNHRLRLGTEFGSDLRGIDAREAEELLGGGDDAGGGLALEGFGLEGLRDVYEEVGGAGDDGRVLSIVRFQSLAGAWEV
jgi:hypothetical protein